MYRRGVAAGSANGAPVGSVFGLGSALDAELAHADADLVECIHQRIAVVGDKGVGFIGRTSLQQVLALRIDRIGTDREAHCVDNDSFGFGIRACLQAVRRARRAIGLPW